MLASEGAGLRHVWMRTKGMPAGGAARAFSCEQGYNINYALVLLLRSAGRLGRVSYYKSLRYI